MVDQAQIKKFKQGAQLDMHGYLFLEFCTILFSYLKKNAIAKLRDKKEEET